MTGGIHGAGRMGGVGRMGTEREMARQSSMTMLIVLSGCLQAQLAILTEACTMRWYLSSTLSDNGTIQVRCTIHLRDNL